MSPRPRDSSDRWRYFDDLFVQFYNESPDQYIGGKNFANLIAQWGFVALMAQVAGPKKPKINIGLAKGTIQGKGGVPSQQGPTANLSPPTNPPTPYTYWYPQYETASPPNPSATQPTSLPFPNIGVATDANNLNSALLAANVILKASGIAGAASLQERRAGTNSWS
jgi:hypothetical protein